MSLIISSNLVCSGDATSAFNEDANSCRLSACFRELAALESEELMDLLSISFLPLNEVMEWLSSEGCLFRSLGSEMLIIGLDDVVNGDGFLNVTETPDLFATEAS